MLGRLIAQVYCASGNDNGSKKSGQDQKTCSPEHDYRKDPRNRRGGTTVPSSKAELGSRA